jgi:hypothetical protein
MIMHATSSSLTLSVLAIAIACGLILVAVLSHAQTVLSANPQAALNNPPAMLPAVARATSEDKTIRPFHINVAELELVDLRRRIAATKWPERETVSDATQGVLLATMRATE